MKVSLDIKIRPRPDGGWSFAMKGFGDIQFNAATPEAMAHLAGSYIRRALDTDERVEGPKRD